MYLLDTNRNHIIGNEGFPILYQVVSVYRDRGRAGIVTSYGEHVGLHPLKDLEYVSEGPLFSKSDYKEGTTVIWIEDEDVYEGVIDTLHESSARIVDVKKLMPIDYSVRIPYWKIPEGRNTYEESTPKASHSKIGYDLK